MASSSHQQAPPLPPSGVQGNEDSNNTNAAAISDAAANNNSNNNDSRGNASLPGSLYRAEVLDFRVEIQFIVNQETKEMKYFPGIIKEVNLRRRNGRVYAKHWVVFDDGEDYWYDLTQIEKEGILRWPAYYCRNHPFKSEHPETHNLLEENKNGTKTSNPDGDGDDDDDDDDNETIRSNQVYRVIRNPPEEAIISREHEISRNMNKRKKDSQGGNAIIEKEESNRKKQKQPEYLSPETLAMEAYRWTEEEHKLYLQGYVQYGRDWNQIASLIKTRTVDEIEAYATSRSNKSDGKSSLGDDDEISGSGRWTKEEDELFQIGVREHKQDWNKVASVVITRTVKQVESHAQLRLMELVRAAQMNFNGEDVDAGDDDDDDEEAEDDGGEETTSVRAVQPQNHKKMGRWSNEEERLFLEGLERYGRNWKSIAMLVKSRTIDQVCKHADKYFDQVGKQADKRYKKIRKPTPRRPAVRWTEEEHNLFLQGLEQYGKNWKKVATLLPTRTTVQVKSHAQTHFGRRSRPTMKKGRRSRPTMKKIAHDEEDAKQQQEEEEEEEEEGEEAAASDEDDGDEEDSDAEEEGESSDDDEDDEESDVDEDESEKEDDEDDDEKEDDKEGGRKIGRWTEDEKALFYSGVEKYGRDFRQIASMIDTRDKVQVEARVNHFFRGTKTVGPWTKKEQARFLEGIKKYGKDNWRKIPPMIPTRSVKQVEGRVYTYFQKLAEEEERLLAEGKKKQEKRRSRDERPKKMNEKTKKRNTGSWTEEEQAIFLRGIEMYGREPKKISAMISTRTHNQVKAHVTDFFRRL